jgi:L-fuconolactonase
VEIVDAHCHVSPVWFEPLETLLFQMDRCGVSQATLVQLLGQYDNRYQEACVARCPMRFSSIVAVDPQTPSAAAELHRHAAAGATGVRLRAETRTPGEDPYAIWRAAEACTMAVSCVGPAKTFLTPQFTSLARTFPTLTIVLEHLGGWARPDCDLSAATRTGLLELARLPNICLKVPTVGQLVMREARLPPAGRTLELGPATVALEMVAHFGPSRLMWGSDFPPLAAREGYENGLNWTLELFAALPLADQAEIFGGTARRVFRLPRALTPQ